MNITHYRKLLVHQVFETFELFGFETRNKYRIFDEEKNPVAFAAEQGKGFFGFLFRQFLGHWRTFEVHFFNNDKKEFLKALHPFRFYFERLEVSLPNGESVGALQKRFSILAKKFDVENERGQVILEMRSPLWKIWSFPFFRNEIEIARIEKKWSGLLTEFFTDKDKFLIIFGEGAFSRNEQLVILAASVFIDIRYFESKARR